MTILITGGAGYIGSHMSWLLHDTKRKAVILDDLSTGNLHNVPPGMRLVVGDIADEATVGRLLRDYSISAIIHFAAKIIVPESVAFPLDYYRDNTAKTRTLIAQAVKHGVKHFIFSSTAAVYGDSQDPVVTEESAKNPASPYGRSKLMVEWMLDDAAKAHGLRYAILRYFNVAGADPQGRTGQSTRNATHLIKVACETALGRRPELLVYGSDYPTGDGSCVRDYIHVTDLVDAHDRALKYLQSGNPSTIINCGYGRGVSVFDVIEAVKTVSGIQFPVRLVGKRAGDPASLVANADKLRKVLEWRPRNDNLTTLVRHAFEWEKKLGPASPT